MGIRKKEHQDTSNTSLTQSLKIKYDWFSRFLSISSRHISNSVSKGINISPFLQVSQLITLKKHDLTPTFKFLWILMWHSNILILFKGKHFGRNVLMLKLRKKIASI